MMPVAKHGDPQLGLDVHLYTTPAGPVPMPAMHLSVVFDPFDYLPFIGSTVKVCGMQRATAGTGGIAIHIPFGFPFAPMLPERDDELFMGSSTVLADGEPLSYTALPVLGCQVVGMPSPPRLKKKKAPKPTLLPTTINLAIPTNVLVGGSPTISLMGLAFAAALKGLGKLRKSKVAKNLGDRFKKARQKLFKNMEPGFLKCKVLRAEPVNILTGEVVLEQTDFTLGGHISLPWIRQYKSGNPRKGACGHGWECPADARLEFDPEDGSLTFCHPSEGPALFPELPGVQGDAGAVPELMDGARLTDQGHELQVRTKTDLIYHFTKSLRSRRKDGITEIPLSRISDLCGNALEFERRGGQLVRIHESSGRLLVLRYQDGLLRSVSLNVPEVAFSHTFVEYEHDPDENLSAARDALGNALSFAYDQHRMVRHTNRTGLSFYYEYDRSNEGWKVVHAWGDNGLYDYRFTYWPAIRERRITDSLGYVWVIQCNEFDLPILEIDPMGGRTIFEYDDSGHTTAVVDQCNRRTEYRYDERGNLLAQTRPDGSTIQIAFDATDKPIRITDGNGNTWQQVWDSRGRLVERRSPLGAVRRLEYGPSGLLIGATDANGAETRLAYTSHGFLTSLTNALGNTQYWRRDELGNIVAAVDAGGRTTAHVYDAKSRLIETRLPGGATVHCDYDAEDQLIRHINENGAETRFEYFGLGLLSKRYQPNGQVLQYDYDTEERLIGVVNQRGEVYELRRDALGRVFQEIDYWGQITAFQYDAAGYLKQRRDPLGRAIDFTVDALGHICRKSSVHPIHADRRFEETFEFDANGNLIACANEHAKVKRSFDAENRLIEEQQNEFGVKNTFDAMGRRIRRETAHHAVTYEYDLIGLVSAIRIDDEAPITFERNVAGEALRETLAPGLERLVGYDADGRLTAQGLKRDAQWLFQTQYEYDGHGNLTQRTDSHIGMDRYGYDPLGQVIDHVDPQGQLERFFQDPAGDRLVTRAQTEQHNDPARWRREGKYGGVSYRFDAVGNLVERHDEAHLAHSGLAKKTRLDWDANRRLVRSSTHSPGDAVTNFETLYGYDAIGRRVFKRTGDTCTGFGWDGDALMAEWSSPAPRTEAQTPSASWREFVYYPKSYVPLALVEENQSYRYYNDPNGCPLRLTRTDGVVVWAAHPEVWGGARILVSEVDNPLRLQGQYADPETGLHYNRFRYFDPVAGQFISQDPLGLLGGHNVYAYAPNALQWVDPLGWIAETATGYNVYGLFDEGATEPYYVGITDDLERRRGEHVTSGRLTEGAQLVPLDEDITYGQARGYEQAYIEHHKTKTGVIGEEISETNRGNKIASFDHNSTTRDAKRQKYFEDAYEAKTKVLKGCA